MEAEAAKLIGAGLAVIGLGGVGAGIGNIFASMISSVGRNPAAAGNVQGFMWIGFALVEAVALYALLIALLLLFVF
ncbi:MAG: F0F1 ATP synthase subunit C [Alphaproteobacteria bacterium]|jgi:F-type H+-transporting ATPase subunit c|nr:F0F1 ATP synthase subunit C [Rhodospirillales bacterium]MBN34450.1 F0F1 ATP synthase subunit C [Rhodospirillaceae bacterium]MDA0221340.1 F0F1 ATP synthase subunit C [Pseudomonadota bacterium]MDG2480220.1 F0F1 ATP synthase subunit C [Alphaproteobacteria bacterium]MBT5432336.1 F0F1 ATP synthase subunit C [Rhodospirillaceae bacterium]|tara:strand:+ start:2325 stop:2552 length:228 start_codon:yes stop_codon:yes gene_type:complete